MPQEFCFLPPHLQVNLEFRIGYDLCRPEHYLSIYFKHPELFLSRGICDGISPSTFAQGATKLANNTELSRFLSAVERRAYKQALYAVRDEHAALDIVQDAMIKLTEKYGSKPATELPLLFQRILQNTIRDYYRRQKVKNTWTTLFSSFTQKNEEVEYDPLDNLQDDKNRSAPAAPDESLQQSQVIALIEQALGELPARQREAFLLRYWEGLDTAETAIAMRCTEGSVKTHCSRAVHALAVLLKEKGVELP